jgi:hypothetical protein
MSIQLLWEIQKIQFPLGVLFPSPITFATGILSTVQMVWHVAKRILFSRKIEASYVAGSLLNFALGDQIALSAQIALVVRKFLKLLDVKETLKKSCAEFYISISGEFPIPEQSSWRAAAKRASFIFHSTKTVCARVAEYALSLVDLTLSFTINSIAKEDAKNSMISNLFESFNELKNDPTKIGREIEENQVFVDWLLEKLQAPIRAHNISALLTSAIKTSISVAELATNTLEQADSVFQTGAFVITTIFAPESISSLKLTTTTPQADDNQTILHTPCKSKLKPYNERFFSTY